MASNPQFGTSTALLFVGNSFTFGRVDPVLSYNAAEVRDLTAPVPGTSFDSTVGSNPYEPHPWSGVAGLFKNFADQAGIAYDIALSTRNAATLQGHYTNSNPAGWDLRGNLALQPWDSVVLQENSTRPLPRGEATLTFAAGAATATLTIDPTADTVQEGDETIGVQLLSGTGYRVGTSGVVTGTILNDDPTGPAIDPALPTVTLTASPAAVAEDGSGRILLTFTRSGDLTGDLLVTFDVARDGSTSPSVSTTTGDFENFVSQFTGSFTSGGVPTTGVLSTVSGGSVLIPAGQASAVLTLDPRPDTVVEADESLYLTLRTNPGYNIGTVGRVAATILNDDLAPGTDPTLPNVTLNLAPVAVFEDGTGSLVYEFARTGNTDQALTVSLAITGTATLPGNDFTQAGAEGFATGGPSSGAGAANLAGFNTYASLIADYLRIGAADPANGAPANANANAATQVWLYETWARPNLVVGALVADTDDTTGAVTTTGVAAPAYYASLEDMTADLKAAYEGLAAANPAFAGVAPVGEAFLAAVQAGVATRDPYAADAGTDGKVDLWWDDNLHASEYGSYLAALTLFGRLTGLDPRSLGAGDQVAADLGITPAEAAALQAVAAATLGRPAGLVFTAPGVVDEAGTPSATLASEGAIGFADDDTAETHTVTVTALTAGARGSLSALVWADSTGDGTGGAVNWHYEAAAAALESLAGGESVTERFLLTLLDSTGGSATQEISIVLNGTNDAPVLTSATTAEFVETATGAAYTVAATDVDAGTMLHYGLAGDDAARFDIDAVTGAVTFKTAPDFEAPASLDGDNVYDIIVTASDGSLETSQAVAITVADGLDAARGTRGPDSLPGTAGPDSVRGLEGDDSLAGGRGDDILRGGRGDDTLMGGEGQDRLRGGLDDDRIIGGLGGDSLRGGEGSDSFVYASAAEGTDRIIGYDAAEDAIEVSAAGFGGGLAEGAAASFVANLTGLADSGAGIGQFIWESDARTLWWDADGQSGTDAVKIATFATILGGGGGLDASEITVIA